ncbi:MAG: lipopolysaccharide biosynthesis protein, partial [Oscillospiraceae bacterium]|nr:lipopolysaccharide biosynthesis protein [Oscillospiraceae bacterium]
MNKGKELAKNTIILTVGKICTQFISFFLLPLYTSLLVPEEFGVVDLFNTYIALLVPIFNWQFENGLFRFMLDCRNNKKEQTAIFSTVICSNVIQALVYICFFLIFQNFISSEYKIFLAIDVVLNIFLNTLLQFPRGLGNNMSYAIGSFISAVTTISFNVILIAGFKMGAYGMFIATVVAKIVTIIYLMLSQKVWRYFSIKKFSKSRFKEISKYSLPLIPNQLSWWVVGASDRTIISQFINIAANGIYTVANKFSTMFITFYNIFNMSWTESVSVHLNDDDSEDFLKETINSMFKLFSSICIGIIAIMPFAFPYFIDNKYSESYQQIPILMIAVLFQVVVGLYSVIYVALKKSVEIAK